jgi:Mg2+/Co2+ transporter CorB
MEIGILFTVLIILVLLALSGFFSGSETALTAASTVRLTSKAKAGNKRAALVNKIREKKERLIGALLLGNNLVNILASALATSVMLKFFGEAGVVYATLVMTFLVLVFAEVLPKTYALHHADRMSMTVAPILKVLVTVLSPITEMVTWIVNRSLMLFGVNLSKTKQGSHLELLRGVIDMHHGPQKKVQEQRVMLRSILDLFNVDVEEIMVHRKNVTMIDADMSMDEIVNIVLNSPHTRLPLYKDDQDNIIGVIHAKLLIKAWNEAGGNPQNINISSTMLDAWYIPETTTLYDQLQAFRERKEHFAIVVDEYGSFMGIVTLEDILEEIVGEIDDEHDPVVSGVRKMKDGNYMIDGNVPIRDLNREYDWNLPEDEEYSTLAGLILFQSQTLPDVGQSFMFKNFRFDIIRKNKNQIERIKVTPPAS